jgi:hypothetical protein
MPSTEPPDDGAAEDIQESAEAALAATSHGIELPLALSLSLITPNKLIDIQQRNESKLGQSQQPLVRQPSGLSPVGGTVALTGAAG